MVPVPLQYPAKSSTLVSITPVSCPQVVSPVTNGPPEADGLDDGEELGEAEGLALGDALGEADGEAEGL